MKYAIVALLFLTGCAADLTPNDHKILALSRSLAWADEDAKDLLNLDKTTAFDAIRFGIAYEKANQAIDEARRCEDDCDDELLHAESLVREYEAKIEAVRLRPVND